MITLAKPVITQNDKKAVLGVLSSGKLSAGENVAGFEAAFSRYHSTRHAIAASNDTTALHAALLALGIKPGDEVLCPAFTFIATANAVLFCGAKPVFCDSDMHTFNISANDIERKLKSNKKIKAVIMVHLYGLACDMRAIRRIVKKHKLLLIEDCAQAIGAQYAGKKAGTFGDIATFSFYATKNMTTGEGGMIITDDKRLAARCRLLVNHGRTSRFTHDILGYNYRMTDFQAALGLSQLSRVNALNNKRIQNAKRLSAGLKNLSWLKTPYVPPGYKHVFHQYTVKIAQGRERLMKYLEKQNIRCALFYPIPLHKQKLYKKLGYGKVRLHNAEKLANQVLSLPVHPALSKKDLNKIVSAVKSYGKN
ncbi:MAG: DegT/DnrJ/EryC1/StrS family aminotransferase [Candidatus Omnitrophota bacterium]